MAQQPILMAQPELVQQLSAMGFSEAAARHGLIATGNSIARAVDWITTHQLQDAGDDDMGKRLKQDEPVEPEGLTVEREGLTVEREGLTTAQRNALTGLNAEPNVEVATEPTPEGGEVEHKPTSKPTGNWVAVGETEQNE